MTKYDFLRFITIFSCFDTTTREYSKIAMALCIKEKRRYTKDFYNTIDKVLVHFLNWYKEAVKVCKIIQLYSKGNR